jgi:hypothetical protein
MTKEQEWEAALKKGKAQLKRLHKSREMAIAAIGEADNRSVIGAANALTKANGRYQECLKAVGQLERGIARYARSRPTEPHAGHAELIRRFIAVHGRPGKSFLEIYNWGMTLADDVILDFGFADRAEFEGYRKFSLSLEGKQSLSVVEPD